MFHLPSAAEPLFMSFSIAFTEPTFQRILPPAVGAILTTGRRTVAGLLRTMRGMVPGHFSSYHRVFSRAAWSLWPLGKVLATAILHFIDPDQPVLVPMDDTTAQHRGKHIYGKGCHHDAVRSARNHVVFRWGHRWVVLAFTPPTRRCLCRRSSVGSRPVGPLRPRFKKCGNTWALKRRASMWPGRCCERRRACWVCSASFA
jgi:hypothetical protein